MKTIEYRITYADGAQENVTVTTRTINAGFTKVLPLARAPLGNGSRREISRIEFWQVINF